MYFLQCLVSALIFYKIVKNHTNSYQATSEKTKMKQSRTNRLRQKFVHCYKKIGKKYKKNAEANTKCKRILIYRIKKKKKKKSNNQKQSVVYYDDGK